MSRIFLFASALFVVAACVAAFSAPFEGMGAREILYARFILIGPAVLVAVLVAALAVIMQKLDRLIAQGAVLPVKQSDVTALPQPTPHEDSAQWKPSYAPRAAEPRAAEPSGADMPSRLAEASPIPARPDAPDAYRTHGEAMLENLAENVKIEDRRAPTVDEFLGQEKRRDEPEQNGVLMREGTFAGRNYRMYEDGSLEIDTDQSTIRFDSLDEFRSFVSNVSKTED